VRSISPSSLTSTAGDLKRVADSLTDGGLDDLVQEVIEVSIDPDLPGSGSIAVDGRHVEAWGALFDDSETADLDGPASKDSDERPRNWFSRRERSAFDHIRLHDRLGGTEAIFDSHEPAHRCRSR
jgi:hypothetical protein